MKTERKAWINWSREEQKWILRLWIDEEWEFSKSWSVRSDGEDMNGNSIDWVHDGIVCEIAHLQNLDYEVRVTC